MDPTLIAIFAILLGLGLGWFLGHRFGSAPVRDWQARHAERDAAARDLDEKFRKAIVDLESKRARKSQFPRKLSMSLIVQKYRSDSTHSITNSFLTKNSSGMRTSAKRNNTTSSEMNSLHGVSKNSMKMPSLALQRNCFQRY